MEKQDVPSDAACPYCGGEPEHNPTHTLSAVGYTHDDIEYTCSDCGQTWPSGVPIGEYDGELAEDLFCSSCEERYGLVHRVQVKKGGSAIDFHMKCPNDECYHFWTFRRHPDDRNTILLGYPAITGSVEDATQPFGYRDET